MVSEYPLDEQNIPPPLDESWWEAVLAEDESMNTSQQAKNPHHSSRQPRVTRPNGNITEDLDWEKAIALYNGDQVISLDVTGYNQGGLLVSGDGLQGFVPISHLIAIPCDDEDSIQELESYTQKTLQLKIIECDRERGRVVFSERAALSEPGSRTSLLENLKACDCVVGTVTNITVFGVFVDLGGVEGLIHVSEISWGRVHHPRDVLSLGQEVEVYVIKIEPGRARVALSLKRLRPNPWENASSRYYPGQVIEAVVTSIVPFGAFARLEEGLDGLIHISEMTGGERSDPEDMLHEGQQVQVRVLHVDSTRQRLGLSLDLNNPHNYSA